MSLKEAFTVRKNIHALELGGTLFVPASHKNLEVVLSGKKYPDLRSVVIDFEDGLANEDRQLALNRLEAILEKLQKTKLLRFIRPQNVEIFKLFLQLKNIDNIDGFVLPKFGLDNAKAYLSIIGQRHFMPSIEGIELFDTQKLQTLRKLLMPYQKQIICIRFGAQDMLRQLGLRQSGSIYDMLLPTQIIANFINTLKPYGFDISAPVYPTFSDNSSFKQEVSYELTNGLLSKTIIHPVQINPINLLYRVRKLELEQAKALLSKEDGVLNLQGQMGEVKTQHNWANFIMKRMHYYGLQE